MNSDFKFINLQSPLIKQVLDLVHRKYTNSTYGEIITLLNKNEKNYFASCNGDLDSYYYDVSVSFEILNNIAFFQCNNDIDLVRKFLYDVYCIIDRKIPKKNCIFIYSEQANAGKNLFFDAVVHLFCNFGQIANFNRYQQFPLMDAVNRRILVWNEPQCESSAFEDVKLLFGGDTMKVKIKYMGDAVVDRTPVIVLGNRDIFPKDSTFDARMIKYKWKPFSELKYVKKKIHPMGFHKLLINYDIISENFED